MLGAHSLGVFALGEFDILPRVDFVGTATLEVLVQRGEVHFTGSATLQVNADNRILAATEDFISQGSDALADRLFPGNVRQALRFSRSIVGGDMFGGLTFGLGELILTNSGGDYDHLINSHALDGRPVTVRLGDAKMAHDSFGTVFRGQSAGYQISDEEFIVEIRDNAYLLDVPASPNTYAGTGGLEGGEELKGRRKPRLFGRCLNVKPASLTPSTTQIFAVSDRAVHDIPAAYVRGVPLRRGANFATADALGRATIQEGWYATCLAQGLIRPSFASPGETQHLTCDVDGETLDGSLAQSTAQVIRLLARAANISVHEASFAATQAAQPAPIGFLLETGSEMTVAAALESLAAAIGGWCGFRRDGSLELSVLLAPTGRTDVPSFDDVTIVAIDRERLPASIDPPPHRLRAQFARNWTVQGPNDLAGSVTEARRALLAEPHQIADAASSPRVLVNHPLAQDPEPFETFLRLEADADREAWRRLRLARSHRSLYRMQLRTAPFALELGREIRVTYPRWDLKSGKNFRLVSVDEDTENNIVEVVAYG